MRTDLRAHCEFTISTTCGSEQGMRKRCAVPLRTRWMVRSSQVGKESRRSLRKQIAQIAKKTNSPLRGFQWIPGLRFFLGKVDTVELRSLRVCWYTWKVAAFLYAFVLLQNVADMWFSWWFSWWSVGRCTMLHVLPVWFIVILEAYGWLPPIDDPKLGFGRGNLYHRDAMVLLAGYMTLHGHMGWGKWHYLSYLQVISKLSSYPSFLVDLQRHNSDSCIWGCERCRADRCFAGHIYCSLLAASYFPLIPWCSMPTREGSNELHFSIFFRGSTGPTGSTSKQFLWPGRIAPTLLWVATDLQLLSHLAADAADDDGFHATPSVSMLDASSWLQLIAAVLFVGSWQEDFYIFSGLHSCTWQMLGLKVFFLDIYFKILSCKCWAMTACWVSPWSEFRSIWLCRWHVSSEQWTLSLDQPWTGS